MSPLLGLLGLCITPLIGELEFERVQLTDVFYCEGASFGDFDRDGHGDVVSGPYWYAGPDFKTRHEVYAPAAVDPAAYSDNFFAWPRDFDGDGWLDVLYVGFPGKQAFWCRNPAGEEGHWERHVVFEGVDNEAPIFADLTGDELPELVFQFKGQFGWAGPDTRNAAEPWRFHPISKELGLHVFTHGLGVGDLSGDGLPDLLWKDGWFERPASLANDPEWSFHPVDFAAGRRGGAQMLVDDVDGDGDADVITALSAHEWGLSWFEQQEEGGERRFVEHRLMDSDPAQFEHGVAFAELHALDLADFDGDGLNDFVTGKRWWSHGAKGDPETTGSSSLYWFRNVPDAKGAARFEPRAIDLSSGVGTQVVAGDVDGDERPDVVVGNKKGSFVFLQRDPAGPAPGANLDLELGTLAGWTATGDAFEGQPVRGDQVWLRGRHEGSRHQGDWWIGTYELHGDGRTGTLTSAPFEITAPFASFLVGGGQHESTRVEVLRASDGEALFKASGSDREPMQRVVVDLSDYQGERISVRLVDEHTGGWGHVNFDDFRFHAEDPAFIGDRDAPELKEYGEVEHSGLPPEEAARAMTVPEGFHVDLIAAEPELHQPVAFTIDGLGRIWVAEAFAYPSRQPDGEGRDDVLVFEDRDGDGAFETRTVFAEGLNLVSGLAVGHGGVWVGAAPYLLFIPDADGDLVPDGEPEVLLDGFGYEDTHETLNSFTWGPDGWLYGCHGVFTHSKVGVPGASDDERTPLNAGVWRYHPTRREFEVFAWGTSNPWGIAFDADGEAFITACVIPHLWYVIPGARYRRQGGSHFGAHVYEDIQTIADHKHYAGDIGDHAWWGRNEPVHFSDTQAAGGGHAHCGALIIQNDVWPEEYRGDLLVGNVHGNRFNREALEREGSGFVGRHRPDFLLANDEWFRAINLEEGPDGAVYFIDWYDARACHRTDSEGWDRTNGRLYRVRYGELAAAALPIDALDAGELLLALLGPDGARAEDALQAVHEGMADGMGLEELLQLSVTEAGAPRERLRALWGLNALGAIDDAWCASYGLAAGQPEMVQVWSVRLGVEDRRVEPVLLERMEQLARETSSARLRLELAAALQRLPFEERWGIAAALAGHGEDDADPNIPLMLWYGVEPLVAEDPARALALARASQIETLRRFVPRRAAHEAAAHDALVAEMETAEGEWLRELLAGTSKAFGEKRLDVMPAGWPALYARLSKADDPEVREPAFSIAVAFGDRAVFPELRARLADRSLEVASRERALDDLVRGRDADSLPIVIALLRDLELRAASIRALASFSDPEAARAILAHYDGFGPEERRAALATLASRPAFARELLDSIRAARIERGELDVLTVRSIAALGDPELDAALTEVWGSVRPTDEEKRAEIAAWKAKLTPEALAAADLPGGREVFARTCEQCHALFGAGGAVGPDITGSNRADLDYLLETVVDPNAVQPKEYQVTVVRLLDGRLASGILKGETEDTLTLVNQNETLVVWKDEVEERVPQSISMMPEGQLAALTDDEVRDLVAYLASPRQTPRRATPADRLFDGETLAGWTGDPAVWSVEDGEIVGRTEGLERNSFLRNELDLGDFRLRFQVRLTPDSANSGVQFRSTELEDGDVAGYQADIGAGWWGKLYEEHGRGLLFDEPVELQIREGEWNDYEITVFGPQIETRLNGARCVSLTDEEGARRGIVALQVHSGGPTEVRFRNFEFELLSEAPVPNLFLQTQDGRWPAFDEEGQPHFYGDAPEDDQDR